MHPDFADHVSTCILSAGRSSSSFVEDRQISPPFAHNSGDFKCNDTEICEYCAPTQFGQVADKVRIIDYTCPSPVSTFTKDAFELSNLYEQISNHATSHPPGNAKSRNILLSFPYNTFCSLHR
jgi:hypothetical protein